MIANIISSGLNLAAEIIRIVAEKGDGADNMRLKDIKGWKTLKKRCRSQDAVRMFRRKFRESRSR